MLLVLIVDFVKKKSLFFSFIYYQCFKDRDVERIHFDSVLLIFSLLLVWATSTGYASAFFLLIHAFFPLMRDFFIYFLRKMDFVDGELTTFDTESFLKID